VARIPSTEGKKVVGYSSFTYILLLILLSSIAGCKTVIAVDPLTIAGREGFIVDGRTQKQEILERLGQAQKSYENGAILIYHVQMMRDGRLGLRQDKHSQCDAFVMVFGDDGVLTRHSYVKHGCNH